MSVWIEKMRDEWKEGIFDDRVDKKECKGSSGSLCGYKRTKRIYNLIIMGITLQETRRIIQIRVVKM